MGSLLLTIQVLLGVGMLLQVSGGVPLNIVLVAEGNGVKVPAGSFCHVMQIHMGRESL